MGRMFNGATSFNQDLSGWCVESVTNSSYFSSASPMNNNSEYLPPFNDDEANAENCN